MTSKADRLKAILELVAELLKSGRPAEAIAPLQAAAELEPSNSMIHHDLGLAYLEVGRLTEAIAAFQKSISNDSRYTDSHFRLGLALEKLGDRRAALAAYDRATELQPSLTEAWFRAGSLVHSMGFRNEAISCFRRAVASGPDTRFGRLGAVRALIAADRDGEAEQALRRLLAADPLDAMAQDLLGNLLSESGLFDQAYDCFARAIAIAPLMAGSYYDLVRCRKVTSEAASLMRRMEAALSTPGLDAEPRTRVLLALGKVADDVGNYAQAMRYFDAAEALRPASATFDCTAFDAEIDRIIARCTPELMARASSLGSSNSTPIFIVGMPRSGTSLVEQIVASHPTVRGGGELNFWNERGAVWHQAGASGTAGPFLRESADKYLRVLLAARPKALKVTDKMPFNFIWAGLIHLAFPNACIIHCRRTAIDTALSIHQTLFHSSLAFPTGGSKLVAYFRSYERLTSHWRRVLPDDRFLEIQYEDLTGEPEPAIRRLIERCGLSWNEACLRPERNPRSVKTPSKWQTRQPIYRNSVERWRRYEPWLGPLHPLLEGK